MPLILFRSRFPGVTGGARATVVSVPDPPAAGIRRGESDKVFFEKDLTPITEKSFVIMADGTPGFRQPARSGLLTAMNPARISVLPGPAGAGSGARSRAVGQGQLKLSGIGLRLAAWIDL
jgi:hypothetical protein